jgi:hypothetical protein
LLLTGVVLLEHAYRFYRLRAPSRASSAAVLGLLVVAASAWYVWPALNDPALELAQAELVNRNIQISKLDADKARLARDAERLHSEVKAAQAQLVLSVAREAQQLAALARDASDVRRALTSGPNALVTDVLSESGGGAFDRLRADVLNLATLRAGATPHVLPEPRSNSTLDALKARMSTRMTTPNYDVEVYPDRELIRGRVGRYYVVDLKNVASGVRFFFDGGKYTLARSSQEFRGALNSFVSEILTKFEGRAEYALFVRGSADQKSYEGAFEPGAEFRRISFVRALGGDKYGLEMGERRVDGRVRNVDLPDLRAAFLQKIVTETYPTKPPIILEGAVTPKTDDRDRNVELILYVDW